MGMSEWYAVKVFRAPNKCHYHKRKIQMPKIVFLCSHKLSLSNLNVRASILVFDSY